MSEVKTDKLTPVTSTTTTFGDSGDKLLFATGTNLDMNGVELILDANANTSITADTDDQIDIKIAGADDFQFTANTFTAQSGSTIAAQALTATTITPSTNIDMNGVELILDADADTSITADTDDQIDIKIAGADDFQFTANTFTALSGSTISIASGATLANSGSATGFGWIFLERVTASGTPGAIEFNDIDGTYDRYMFAIENVIPASDGQNFNIRISTDNGSTFISSSSYSILRQRMGTEGDADETGQTTIYSSYQGFGGQSSEGCSGTIYLYDPANSARKPMVQGHVFGFTTADALTSTEVVGVYNGAADMDAIQFSFTAGNIVDGGHITMYGLSKS